VIIRFKGVDENAIKGSPEKKNDCAGTQSLIYNQGRYKTLNNIIK